ncbi:hypothetical protein ACLOJK_020576 [Asimina triloba]
MKYLSRAWVIAASVGAVESLKDQMGLCRWNYGIRSLHEHAQKSVRSYAQASHQRVSSALSSSASSSVMTGIPEEEHNIRLMAAQHEKMKRREESLKNVMYMSCWGYN